MNMSVAKNHIFNVIAITVIVFAYIYTFQESIRISICVLSPACEPETYGYAGRKGFTSKKNWEIIVSSVGAVIAIIMLHNPRKGKVRALNFGNLIDAGIIPQKGASKAWIHRGVLAIPVYTIIISMMSAVLAGTPESDNAQRTIRETANLASMVYMAAAGVEEELLLIPAVMLAVTVFTRRRWAVVVALICAGVLRVIFHLYYGVTAIPAIFIIWVPAAVILWLYTKNIWGIVIGHALNNLMANGSESVEFVSNLFFLITIGYVVFYIYKKFKIDTVKKWFNLLDSSRGEKFGNWFNGWKVYITWRRPWNVDTTFPIENIVD